MNGFFQDYNPEVKKEREKYSNQLITHLTKTNIDEESNLQKIFFSDENIDLINKQIILTVYKRTQYKINFQNKDKILIVMQYIFNEHARHLPYNIKGQIQELNCRIVKNIIGDIITNFEQKIVYLRDIETRREPIPLPISSTYDRTLPVNPNALPVKYFN